MSVHKIEYSGGKKVMVPVADKETYLAWRQSEEQRRTTDAARRGETFRNRNGEEVSVKTRLGQYNYSCLPNADGTLARTKTLSNAVAMDIDYPGSGCGMELEAWKEDVKARVMARRDDVGALMFGDSATKGFHLVFRRHADLSQEENLRWASEVLGVAFDKCAKDHTRVMFEPSGEIYILDDELFVMTPCASPEDVKAGGVTDATDVTNVTCDKKNFISAHSGHEEHSGHSEHEGHSGHEASASHGDVDGTVLPYHKILPAFFRMECQSYPDVPEGVRNDTLFAVVAKYLRYCTDHKAEVIKNLLYPDYSFGLPETEVAAIIRSALSRDRSLTPKVVKEVLRRYAGNGDGGARMQEVQDGDEVPYRPLEMCIIDEVQLPNMPRWVNALLKPAPPGYRFQTLALTVPAMATLLTDVTAQFGRKAVKRLNAWTHLDGPPASNKGICMSPIPVLMKPLQEIDDANQAREDEYFQKCDMAKNKRDQPKPPQDIVIRILPPNTTRLQHILRMRDAKGKHTYTYCEEISSMQLSQGGQYTNREDFMRYLFDNGMVGNQSFVRNSIRCRVPVAWNLSTEGTRDQTLKTWANSVTNGGTTRVFFVFVPDNLTARMPEYVQYTDDDKAYIERAARIMMQMNGHLSTPKLDRVLNEWVETVRKESIGDSERLILKNRSADIAHTLGVVMQLAWTVQHIMDQEDREGSRIEVRDIDLNAYSEKLAAVDMALYAANECLEGQYKLWARRMKQQLETAYEGVAVFKKQDETFVALPDEPFTYEDLAVIFPKRKAATLRKMVERLKSAGKLCDAGVNDIGMKQFRKINQCGL